MRPRVTVRCASPLGAWATKLARNLAIKLSTIGAAASKYQIVDGFLLQAKRIQRTYSAQVMDPPGFIYLAGMNDLNTPIGRNNQQAVGVGARAEFAPKELVEVGGLQYQAKMTDDRVPAYMLLPFSGPPADGFDFSLITLAPTLQDRGMLSGAYLQCSTLSLAFASNFNPLDDRTYFTEATPAAVGGGAIVPVVSAVGMAFTDTGPVIGDIPRDYLAQNGFWVTESMLPANWRLHPRRQVQYTEYSTADAYRSRTGPGLTQPGFTHAVGQTGTAEGVDLFCVAARVFRQHQGTWYASAPGTSYRPRYYDRNGEQGLMVAIGQYNRAEYNPQNPPARAAVQTLQIVVPADLPIAELRPLPELLPTWDAYDKPDLPNYGEFLVPHPARAGNGFVVFSVYRTRRDENPRDDSSPDEDLIGLAYALVTTVAGGDSTVLLADWDYGDGGAPIPTSSPGSFIQPWIVGACHLRRETSQGESFTAACLVWEHEYRRRAESTPSQNRGIGGRLVLYTSDGGAPVRRPLAVAAAPLFAPSMDLQPGDPYVLNSNGSFPGRAAGSATIEPFSELQALGDGTAVTAAIARPYPVTGSDRVSQALHPIHCMRIDLATGEAELLGVIADRVRAYTKCMISVVQAPMAGRSAVLLATVVDHVTNNVGANGQVYISRDGGDTWGVYITDVGAQAGAFYIGNKLRWHSTERPLSLGISA